jgi:hypothetical protein
MSDKVKKIPVIVKSKTLRSGGYKPIDGVSERAVAMRGMGNFFMMTTCANNRGEIGGK